MVTHLADSKSGVIFAAARSKTTDLGDLIKASCGRVVYIEMDTTNPDGVTIAAETVRRHLGDEGLDYLVNNAGLGGFAPGWAETLTDLNEEFNVNVLGSHIVTTKSLPLLRKGQSKKIMNV